MFPLKLDKIWTCKNVCGSFLGRRNSLRKDTVACKCGFVIES